MLDLDKLPRGRKDPSLYKKLYKFIIKYKTENDGLSPSLREMMKVTGIKTTSHMSYALRKLCDEGLIEMGGKGLSRGIKVVGGCWLPPKEDTPCSG